MTSTYIEIYKSIIGKLQDEINNLYNRLSPYKKEIYLEDKNKIDKLENENKELKLKIKKLETNINNLCISNKQIYNELNYFISKL